MSNFKVSTTHVRPPIPSRIYDHCVYFDDDDEHSSVGWGSTVALAMADLEMLVEFSDMPEDEREARLAALKDFAKASESPADERDRRDSEA